MSFISSSNCSFTGCLITSSLVGRAGISVSKVTGTLSYVGRFRLWNFQTHESLSCTWLSRSPPRLPPLLFLLDSWSRGSSSSASPLSFGVAVAGRSSFLPPRPPLLFLLPRLLGWVCLSMASTSLFSGLAVRGLSWFLPPRPPLLFCCFLSTGC